MKLMKHIQEEIANALTHGLGVLGGIAGGAVLITLASLYGDVWQIISASVFTAALILLYAASTLYHAIPGKRAKAKLQVLDHCAIFVLIAGTYTPFTLVSLQGAWGWWLFGVVWGLAVLGIIFKLFFTGRYEKLSTIIYIAMGWMVLVALKPLFENLSMTSFGWLLAGGLLYTAGTFFYHQEEMRFAHAIWHLFVLGGSVCHFVAVMQQIVPALS